MTAEPYRKQPAHDAATRTASSARSRPHLMALLCSAFQSHTSHVQPCSQTRAHLDHVEKHSAALGRPLMHRKTRKPAQARRDGCFAQQGDRKAPADVGMVLPPTVTRPSNGAQQSGTA